MLVPSLPVPTFSTRKLGPCETSPRATVVNNCLWNSSSNSQVEPVLINVNFMDRISPLRGTQLGTVNKFVICFWNISPPLLGVRSWKCQTKNYPSKLLKRCWIVIFQKLDNHWPLIKHSPAHASFRGKMQQPLKLLRKREVSWMQPM